jgi:hypothetical protein
VSKIPIDLTQLANDDLYPEGRHRARIASATLYPEDQEIGPEGELVGQSDDQGRQRFAWWRLGFAFTEHPSNYGVDEKGRPISIVGRYAWRNYFLRPGGDRRRIVQLYDAAGVALDPEGIDLSVLVGREVDVEITTGKRRDTGEPTSEVSRVRTALDK